MKGRKIARQRYTPAQRLLILTMAHRSMPRQEPVKPKRVQALCRGHPCCLSDYQLSRRSSGFATHNRGCDWTILWVAAWSACDAATLIQRFNCNPTGSILKGLMLKLNIVYGGPGGVALYCARLDHRLSVHRWTDGQTVLEKQPPFRADNSVSPFVQVTAALTRCCSWELHHAAQLHGLATACFCYRCPAHGECNSVGMT